jgi:hypothetical protein
MILNARHDDLDSTVTSILKLVADFNIHMFVHA